MIGFFPIAANDQSYYYLGQIFGNVGTALQPEGSAGLQLSLFGSISQTLNTTALVIGVILLIYTIIVGLLKTSQEGQFLGKEWNSLWIPLRMVMGIVSLFPTGSGYSVLQVVIMWAIIQGIGAADAMWNTTLNYVSIFGSPYAKVSIPTTVGISQSISTLYQDLVCADAAQRGADGQTFQDRYPDSTSKTGDAKYYYCANDYPSSVVAPIAAGTVPTKPAADQTFCTQDKLSTMLKNPGNYPGTCIFNTDSVGNPAVQCAIGPRPARGIGACGAVQISYYSPQMASTCSQLLSTIGQQNNLTQLIQCGSYQAASQIVPVVVGVLELMAAQTNQYDNDYMHFYANNLSPTPTQQVPDWIQRFCTQHNIGANACCLFNPIYAVLQTQEAAMAGQPVKPMSKPTCTLMTSSIFPLMNNTLHTSNSSKTDQVDYTNMNPALAATAIWPCGLEPTVANQSPAGCFTTQVSAGNFIQNQINNYSTYIDNAVGQVITAYVQSSSTTALTGWFADAQNMGWLLAGSYYYTMAQQNSANLAVAVPTFNVIGSDMLTNTDNVMLNYRNNYGAATSITSTISNAANNTGSESPAMAQMSAINSSAGLGISTSFMGNLAGGTNPLSAMQAEGESLLSSAQTIYITTTIVMFALTVVSNITFVGLGTGIGENAFGQGVIFIVNWLMGLVLAYMAWAYSFGGLLAVYIPLVPYTIFIFASIGWFTGVIEVMVAAPFIAIGILMPGGRHELLGHAEPAMMMLLNVILRPTFMIVGMMAAMLFASVVVSFINAGFLGAMNTIVGTSPSMIEIILFISAYSMLLITALNKCYSLIFLIPDKVLTWIGGHAGSYGEAESVSQVKAAVEKTADTVSGAMKSSAESSVATAKGAYESRMAEAKALHKDFRGIAKGNVDHEMGEQGPQQRPADFKDEIDLDAGEVNQAGGVQGPQPSAGIMQNAQLARAARAAKEDKGAKDDKDEKDEKDDKKEEP
jgi:hypothetical protein